MKPPLPRTLSAVPRLPHVQLEIAKAIHILMASDREERLESPEETATGPSWPGQIAEIIGETLQSLCKAGFDPDEPRVPAGSSKGGQWTTSDGDDASNEPFSAQNSVDLWSLDPQYAANNSPGMGHNQGPPLGEPPPIPPRLPATRTALNTFIKAAAYWLATVGNAAAARYVRILQAVYWIATQALPFVRAYLSSPKTLKELQQDVLNPRVGYDIHHIVEQTPARKEGFSDDIIDGPDNLVRIPTLKHWQINGWYGRPNKEFGDLSPRDYLRGKNWDERRRVGVDALIRFGVLKP